MSSDSARTGTRPGPAVGGAATWIRAVAPAITRRGGAILWVLHSDIAGLTLEEEEEEEGGDGTQIECEVAIVIVYKTFGSGFFPSSSNSGRILHSH